MRSLCLCVVLLAACAALPKPIEEPTIEVTGVAVTQVDLRGIYGEARFSITNPNGFGVPLRGGSWELAIGSATAMTGVFELSETIPAKATAPLATGLFVAPGAAANAMSQLARGERQYTIRGVLQFTTRLGDLDVAFSHSGLLDY